MTPPDNLKTLILEAQRLLLICHVTPDGDAIGSLLGLGWSLRKAGKQVTLACPDTTPTELQFLPGADEIGPARPEALAQAEVIVILDSSDRERIASQYVAAPFQAKPVIVIDHHVTNVLFGDVNWVEPTAAATAQMCAELIRQLGLPLDEEVALCLLTGIVTDTRCFRTSNTTAEVLAAATRLIEAGASLADVTERVFRDNSLARICLWARALGGVQMKDRVIWTEVSREMLKACGAGTRDTTGLANFLDATRDTDVSIVLVEKNGKVEASMRAQRGVDISGVAFGLGGGGHPQAAGFTRQGTLAEIREQVLSATWAALREQGRA